MWGNEHRDLVRVAAHGPSSIQALDSGTRENQQFLDQGSLSKGQEGGCKVKVLGRDAILRASSINIIVPCRLASEHQCSSPV